MNIAHEANPMIETAVKKPTNIRSVINYSNTTSKLEILLKNCDIQWHITYLECFCRKDF